MDKINGGATIWARQTIDSDIFYNKPDKWFKIWFYLITKVSHKDNKQFKRGSCFLKYEWIMQKTKANKNEIDHCIRWLKSATMIATAKATGGFIVTVNKYNGYQSLENYKSDTKSDSKSETKAKQKRNKSDTINKNDNNDKNVIKKEKGIIFLKAWKDFKIMRTKIRKPLTERAEELIITRLDKLASNELTQVAILNQSIMNSWQGVFPLKSNEKDEDYIYQKYQSKKMTKEEIEKSRKTGQAEAKKMLEKLKHQLVPESKGKEKMPMEKENQKSIKR